MLYTKTRMVLLLQDSTLKQEALAMANQQLENSHRQISELISSQEKIIENRTKELKRANASLIELIQFNSHNISEPVARILGLVQLQSMVTSEEFFTDYWPLLEQSVQDMDNTIRQIVYKTENIEHDETISD